MKTTNLPRQVKLSKVTFREEDHTYWLGEPGVGVKLYGANEMLKLSGLVNTTHYTEHGKTRGSFAHLMCEAFDRKDQILDQDTLDPELRPYLDAYIKFTEVCQPEWTGIEKLMHDGPLRIAGTVDRIGTMRPGGTGRKVKVVVDLKSGAYAPWHGLQLACYQHLVTREMLKQGAAPARSSKPLVERYGVYLTKKGTYSLKHFTETTDIAVLMGARAICLWKETHG